MNLYELGENWKSVFNMLEDSEMDEQMIFDTLESIEGDIDTKAENYGKIIRMLEGKNETIEIEIDRLKERKEAVENRIKKLKINLQNIMQEMGKTKIETPLFTFWVQKNPASLKIAEDFNFEDMPEEYLIPQEPKIDRAKIKEDIKSGKEIEWATLVQGESLRIK